MRQPLRNNRAGVQTAVPRSIPFPIDGWDTESALANMKNTSAVILDNLIPRGGFGELRRGFIEQVTGTADPVETLIAYSGSQLLACAGPDIYDVTEAAGLGSALYASATSARWNYTNFANDAGVFAILVNGVNTPQKYDGSTISATAITGTSGSINLVPEDLKWVMAHKRRLHFVEKETLRVWFLDVEAIAGAAGLLDLGPVFSKGGTLVGLARLTLDGGIGPDDFACYLTTEGQVAVYQGTDPSDAANWALVGTFNLPRPIGDRSLLEDGTDVMVLTEAGLISLTAALRLPTQDRENASKSQRITTAVSDAAQAYGSNFGWQVLTYPGRGGLTIVNVPTAELSTSVQYVRASARGAWCQFTGIDAFCWGYANGKAYFGSTLGVYRWDTGASDNGEPIVGDVLPAFQDFGSRTQTKDFTMVRALLRAPAIVTPALDVVTDFDKNTVPTDIQTVVTPNDISPDDSSLIRDDWTAAAGSGYFGSPRMRIALTGEAASERVAVTSDHTSLLLVGPGGTDNILDRPNLPLDVVVQCIGWDVMFLAGGAL